VRKRKTSVSDPLAALREWLTAVGDGRPGDTLAQANLHAACHEAAHAVVAVRLGLRLVDTDIIERGVRSNTSSGRTRLADANPAAEAIVGAASIAADGNRSVRFWDVSPNAPTAGDVEKLADFAQRLGVLRRWEDFRDDPAFGPWATAAVERARDLLRADGGAAWECVREALLHRNRLLGPEVMALVAESDKATGFVIP